MSDEALNILVRGRVQGVGYRRYAQRRAAELKINGWARNLYNGDVEVYAQSDTQSLGLFVEELKKGPAMSHVEEVKVLKVKNEKLDGFIILPDGAPT
jgi:acylphosphatase